MSAVGEPSLDAKEVVVKLVDGNHVRRLKLSVGRCSFQQLNAAVSKACGYESFRVAYKDASNTEIFIQSDSDVLSALSSGVTLKNNQTSPVRLFVYSSSNAQPSTTTNSTTTSSSGHLRHSSRSSSLASPQLLRSESGNSNALRSAMSYLDRVKAALGDQSPLFRQFLNYLAAYKADSSPSPLRIQAITDRMQLLFKDHPDLFQGFRAFLPDATSLSSSTASLLNAANVPQSDRGSVLVSPHQPASTSSSPSPSSPFPSSMEHATRHLDRLVAQPTPTTPLAISTTAAVPHEHKHEHEHVDPASSSPLSTSSSRLVLPELPMGVCPRCHQSPALQAQLPAVCSQLLTVIESLRGTIMELRETTVSLKESVNALPQQLVSILASAGKSSLSVHPSVQSSTVDTSSAPPSSLTSSSSSSSSSSTSSSSSPATAASSIAPETKSAVLDHTPQGAEVPAPSHSFLDVATSAASSSSAVSSSAVLSSAQEAKQFAALSQSVASISPFDEDTDIVSLQSPTMSPQTLALLDRLQQMGYTNRTFNAVLLEMHNNDLDKVVQSLKVYFRVAL